METVYHYLLIYFVSLINIIGAVDQGDSIFLIQAVKQENSEILEWLINEKAVLDVQDSHGKTPLMYAASLENDLIARTLVEEGANIEITDHLGRTALHYAASSGQKDILSYLYDLDLNLTATDLRGDTALHLASAGGHVDAVSYLLDQGEDHFNVDYKNLTSIHLAALNGHIPVLSLFLNKSVNIDVKQYANGSTPLILAVMHNKTDTCKFLVDVGADVNSYNYSMWSVMHASSHSGNIDLLEYFFEKNASIDQNDLFGRTPLFIATERGYLQIVKYLVKKGCNTSTIDAYGNSLMHAAATSGNLKIIKYLVGKKLLLDAKNNLGTTPLIIASKHGHLQLVKYLVIYQCNVNSVNIEGMSAFHAAAFSGNVDLVKYFISLGVSIVDKDADSRTPLHIASLHGRLPVVKLLVDQMTELHFNSTSNHESTNGMQECLKCLQSKVNVIDKYGKTPIYLAAENGKLNTLKFLLEHSGDHNAMDNVGRSPFHAAAQNGMIEILRLLVLQNVFVDSQDNQGQTALFATVEANQWDSFVFLIDVRANKQIKDKMGRTVVHLAAIEGHLEMLKSLTFKQEDWENIDVKDYLNNTPAWYATRYGNLKCLSYLVDIGAAVTADLLKAAIDNGRIEVLRAVVRNGGRSYMETEESKSVFEHALSKKNISFHIIKYFINSSAKMSVKSMKTILQKSMDSEDFRLVESLETNKNINLLGFCSSFLREKVEKNSVTQIKYLLSRGCKTSERYSNDDSLLHIAARYGSGETIAYLLSTGMNKSIKNQDGDTPVLYAIKYDQVSPLEFLLSNKTNEGNISLTNSINEDDKTNEHSFLVKLAAKTGSLEVVKYFLKENNQDIEQVDQRHRTLLHLAVESNNGLLVKYLLDSGANINAKDDEQNRPIHLAVKYLKSLKVLLEYGAETTVSNANSKSPLELAYDSNNLKAAKCLLKYGALLNFSYVSYYSSSSFDKPNREMLGLFERVRYSNRNSLTCGDDSLESIDVEPYVQ